MSRAALGRASWDQRITRALNLAEVRPAAAAILLFYARLAELQRDLGVRLQAAPGTLTASVIETEFPAFVAALGRIGPAAIAEAAEPLLAVGPEVWRELLDAGEDFFARAFLQPWAEVHYAGPQPGAGGISAVCPCCGHNPQAAVLREEGHGARRNLMCSWCQNEWEFQRILCPMCGEDGFEKLPVFQAEQHPATRVDACDTCKAYLLAVDMTKDGHAVAEVDDIAAVSLHLWAQEQGYHRASPGLFGY